MWIGDRHLKLQQQRLTFTSYIKDISILILSLHVNPVNQVMLRLALKIQKRCMHPAKGLVVKDRWTITCIYTSIVDTKRKPNAVVLLHQKHFKLMASIYQPAEQAHQFHFALTFRVKIKPFNGWRASFPMLSRYSISPCHTKMSVTRVNSSTNFISSRRWPPWLVFQKRANLFINCSCHILWRGRLPEIIKRPYCSFSNSTFRD